MSFNVSVTVRDGAAAVTTSGEVPEGTYTVAGHADDLQAYLSVYQADAAGKFVASAQATHSKGA